MYISPTEPSGGGLCATQAATHLPALPSKHIGSGHGVSGASGMQVQPFVPLRNVVGVPLASTVIMEASCAMAAGAADSALVIGSPALAVALFLVSAAAVLFPFVLSVLLQAPTMITAPVSSRMRRLFDVIGPSMILRKDARSSTTTAGRHVKPALIQGLHFATSRP